jgi:hypothetical protein
MIRGIYSLVLVMADESLSFVELVDGGGYLNPTGTVYVCPLGLWE